MSHVTGTVQPASLTIGPASGAPATSPGVWAADFAYSQAPDGTKLVILHFTAVSLPGANRLEVDLGYGTDVFTAGSGATFWTRPINVYKLAGGVIPIRYIASGPPAGSAHIDQYGRGERHAGLPGHNSFSNSDPFLADPVYTEPQYDDFWFCTGPLKWENVACVPGAGDIRATVARSVGMIVSVEGSDVSTCSVTLVDADKVISAGHCHTPAEALGSSVTFDYQLECNGARPAGYDAHFHKVVEVLSHHNDAVGDFSLLRLAGPVAGIAPIQMRPDLPGVGEAVFGVHHPNGAPKKLSPQHAGFSSVSAASPGVVSVPSGFHVSGGSSGSGLFDKAGRIVGVLSNGNPCGRGSAPTDLSYFPIATVLKAIAPAPPPPVTRDVMVVFDRSGSMDESDAAGRKKIEAARDAASLFVQLVKSSVGNRVGLASFSTSATVPVDFALQSVDPPHKQTLVGTAPYAAGLVGGLVPGGATSIGAGLEQARQQFPGPGANPRAILLLTDGMQNTPPLVSDVDPGLVGITVHAIGFGRDSNIDGTLLATLTAAHAGQYTRAESGLALEKFFSHAFGNIFEAGIISDPEFTLATGQLSGPPHPFPVCGEDEITVVLGWDLVGETLEPVVRTPGGTVVVPGSAGVVADRGRTWSFVRIRLPVGAERDGSWSVTPERPGHKDRELIGEAPALRYFVNVIPTGGPHLELVSPRRVFYTGETINPMVRLRNTDGSWPDDVAIVLVAERPTVSLGALLSRETLHQPTDVAGDTIPARQVTAAVLEASAAGPLIPLATETIALSDAPEDTSGRFEPAATFGRQLDQLTAVDGHCQLQFKATYGGPGCSAARELLATLLIEVGIDPAHSHPTLVDGGARPDGRHQGTLTVTPGDRFGNQVGPGRPGAMIVTGASGTTVTGPPHDNGDGSYSVPIVWDPAGGGPGIVIGQPGRPPITVGVGPPPSAHGPSFPWWLIVLLLVIVVVILLIILLT